MVHASTAAVAAAPSIDVVKVDMRLVRQFGSTAAVIHAYLMRRDQGDGAEVSCQAVADETGVSPSTTRRTLAALRDGGLLKPERQGGRLANRYQLPMGADNQPEALDVHFDHPGSFPIGTEDQEVVHIEEESRLSTESVSNSSISNLEVDPVPRGCRRPGRGVYGRRLNIVSPEIFDLVQLFEDYVRPGSKKPITAGRRNAWHATAVKMVFERKRSLLEIGAVITMVFEDEMGKLPAKPKYGSDRKVTRLAQIDENWDVLEDCLLGQFRMPRTVSGHVDARIATKYFKTLPNSDMERQALGLAESFESFRDPAGLAAKNSVSDHGVQFSREGWRKTFRIMLAKDGRSFDDIALVISGLRECDEHIDINRIVDAYHLRRDFDFLLETVVAFRDAYSRRDA